MSAENKLPAPKFLLPSPDFNKPKPTGGGGGLPHFLTPFGIQNLSKSQQPPPMYGPRGATIPPKFMAEYKQQKEKPEYCEPCDKEFHTKSSYNYHLSEHEVCPVDGCKFSAHPKVLDKHVESTHNSGLFERIQKLSSPEEIAKWREERKKRYPTVQNVQMRQQIQKEKNERGEKLTANKSRFGRPNERRQLQQQGDRQPTKGEKWAERRQKFQKRRNEEKSSETANKVAKIEEKPVEEEKLPEIVEEILMAGELPMFRGTSKMKDYNRVVTKCTQNDALGGLMGAYGTDSEEEEEESDSEGEEIAESAALPKVNSVTDDKKQIVEISTTATDDGIQNRDEHTPPTDGSFLPVDEDLQVKESEITPEEDTVQNEEVEDNDAPEEVPVNRNSDLPEVEDNDAPEELQVGRNRDSPEVEDNEAPEELPVKRNSDLPEPEKRKPYKKTAKKRESGLEVNMGFLLRKTKKQNTMLEKLLETQIVHERNVLLQCVRYVVDNNFFQTDNK